MSGAGHSLFAVAGVLALGAMSPGASFLLVARLAALRSRRAGLAAAVGMGVGCAVFALLALCGLQVLLTRVPVLHRALAWAGAGYLLWQAWRMWPRSADSSASNCNIKPKEEVTASGSDFLLGLLTQLGNPQTALVFASVFAALLPATHPAGDFLLMPALAFCIDAGWFALVACLLSATMPQQLWLRVRRPLDRISALIMTGLAARLLLRAP